MLSLRVAIALALLVLTVTAAVGCTVDSTATAGPSPASTPILMDPLDPRAGPSANRVGAPLFALLVVVGLGVAAAATTMLFVRMTRRR